ncbi:MAG: 2-isopropylmalate synthase [Candidatus Micrarchaeia archaeon]
MGDVAGAAISAQEAFRGIGLPKSVKVFDTTLRDGEQTPGVNLTVDQKFALALALDDLGVDVLEAGFPASSEGERELFRRLADRDMRAKLCGLARTCRPDLDAAMDSGADYVHTFIATSELHMKHKLKMTRQQVLDAAVDSVEYVRSHGIPCEFSAEDATRTDLGFLKQVYREVEDAGATMLNVPDTVGVSVPRAYYRLVKEVGKSTHTPISVHAHNDLGVAVANTLAGVEAGASQVQVTINGLGERSGNAALEDTVVALANAYGVGTNIRMERLLSVSQMIARATRVHPPRNKPVVGENSFAQSAGIHVHGTLASTLAYEPYPPETVGQNRRIILGKLTGFAAVKNVLSTMGFDVSNEQARHVTAKVKEMGDRGRRIQDFELVGIAEKLAGVQRKAHISLGQVLITTGNSIIPTASVKAVVDGEERTACATGIGPVDAALNALSKVSGERTAKLKEYKLEAINGGSDALCEVTVTIEDAQGKRRSGFAIGPDIVMASVEAMASGMNNRYTNEDNRKAVAMAKAKEKESPRKAMKNTNTIGTAVASAMTAKE